MRRELVPGATGPTGAVIDYVDSRDALARQRFTRLPSGRYEDQDGFEYQYDAVTRQYEVIVAAIDQYWDPPRQRQYTKHVRNTLTSYAFRAGVTPVTIDNASVRYRYDPAAFVYVELPARAWWVDAHGRFVDRYDRVLDPTGQRVDKQYLLGQDADRNFVLPVKLRDTTKYIPGLPNLPGGNVDPTDADAHAAATRELREETDFLITADASVPVGSSVHAGNMLSFRAGTVRATSLAERAARPVPAPPPEMDYAIGLFRFRATSIPYVHGTTTDLQIRTAILNRFAADKHVNLAGPFFTTALPSGHTPLEEFHDSATVAALVDRVKQDNQAYQRGLTSRRQAMAAAEGHPEYLAARSEYDRGLADRRAGTFDATRNWPAYIQARTDYDQGLADKAVGAFDAARAWPAYVRAGADHEENQSAPSKRKKA